jgi:hypothetical protein
MHRHALYLEQYQQRMQAHHGFEASMLQAISLPSFDTVLVNCLLDHPKPADETGLARRGRHVC